jgi:hypothetical protein
MACGFRLIEASTPPPPRAPAILVEPVSTSRLLSGTRYPDPRQAPSIVAVARAYPVLPSNAASAPLRCGLDSPPVLIPPLSYVKSRGLGERALIPPTPALISTITPEPIPLLRIPISRPDPPCIGWHPRISYKTSFCLLDLQAKASSPPSIDLLRDFTTGQRPRLTGTGLNTARRSLFCKTNLALSPS